MTSAAPIIPPMDVADLPLAERLSAESCHDLDRRTAASPLLAAQRVLVDRGDLPTPPA